MGAQRRRQRAESHQCEERDAGLQYIENALGFGRNVFCRKICNQVCARQEPNGVCNSVEEL